MLCSMHCRARPRCSLQWGSGRNAQCWVAASEAAQGPSPSCVAMPSTWRILLIPWERCRHWPCLPKSSTCGSAPHRQRAPLLMPLFRVYPKTSPGMIRHLMYFTTAFPDIVQVGCIPYLPARLAGHNHRSRQSGVAPMVQDIQIRALDWVHALDMLYSLHRSRVIAARSSYNARTSVG